MKHSVDLKTLDTFVTVAKLGSLTKAAALLHMTQPALSHRLKHLTDVTGLTLFKRSPHGLELTLDGLALSLKANQVINALDDFERTIKNFKDNVRGKLRIGTIIDPEFTRLGALLVGLVDAAPGIEKELRQGMSGNVAEWILSEQIDVGYYLGELPQDASKDLADQKEPVFFQKKLTAFEYFVIAPKGWESKIWGRNWSDLAQLPWIGSAPASIHNRLLSTVYSGLGVLPNFIAQVDQESSMLAMVRSGIGLSLCRDSVALAERSNNGIVVSELCTIPCSLSFISLYARRHEYKIACAFDALSRSWA
jgi:DNA-binding transcriptional LysR family regulator